MFLGDRAKSKNKPSSILSLVQKNKLAIKMVMLVVEIDHNLDLIRDKNHKLDANHLIKYLEFRFKTDMVF